MFGVPLDRAHPQQSRRGRLHQPRPPEPIKLRTFMLVERRGHEGAGGPGIVRPLKRLCARAQRSGSPGRPNGDRPHTPPAQPESWLHTAPLPVHHRLGQRGPLFDLRRRQGPMRRMRPEPVVPCPVSIELTLNPAHARHQKRPPCPRLEIPEEPLHLRVEMPGGTRHRT